ncbi:MAG: SMC-Scp complex subunit ScpB [Pseudomonadota bacterium]
MAEELARALNTPQAAQDEHHLRVIEAVLFASPASMHESKIAAHLPEGVDIPALLARLQEQYSGRGIHLKKVAGRWMFRTANDLGHLLHREVHDKRRLSKAALETLSIIAYHQPVTRAEIEEVRGVSTSSGTLDILLETNWVRMRGRRRAPGRPVTYGTTDTFLEHFGLNTIRDLPGLMELKGSGLLDPTMPANFDMPQPTDVADLLPDELPLEDDDIEDEDLFQDAADLKHEPDEDDEPTHAAEAQADKTES